MGRHKKIVVTEQTGMTQSEPVLNGHDLNSSSIDKETLDAFYKHGIDIKGLNDIQILNKIPELSKKIREEAENDSLISNISTKISAYMAGTEIEDAEFATDLYFLNVPKEFLKIFTDKDKDLIKVTKSKDENGNEHINRDGKKIWEKIRNSNVFSRNADSSIFN